jgi:hypothetical protein
MRDVKLLVALVAGMLLATVSSGAGLVSVRVGLCSLEAEPAEERALHALASKAPGILSELESDLGLRPGARFRMVLIPARGIQDDEVARLDAEAPPWAAGYYVPSRRVGAIRISQAARYPYGTIESVFGHETTHALLHDVFGGRLPRWFEEGVATLEGRRWSLEDALIYTRSLLTSDLPALDSLDREFRSEAGNPELAYAASFSFVSWSVRREGPDFLRRLLRELRAGTLPGAWENAAGESLAEAERAWRRETLIRYRWIPVITASSTLWIGITFLAVAAILRRRARARAIRDRWRAEEEAADEDEEWKEQPAASEVESRTLLEEWHMRSEVDLSREEGKPAERKEEP